MLQRTLEMIDRQICTRVRGGTSVRSSAFGTTPPIMIIARLALTISALLLLFKLMLVMLEQELIHISL